MMAWSVSAGTRMTAQPGTMVSRPIAPPAEGAANQFSLVLEDHEAPKPPTAETVSRAAAVLGATSWQLLLQHADGSLDQAVRNARLRNLWLSFSILSVLAASVGLIVLNARRSERLAAQQMDFVATVSHELRTPLAVIRSAAQNLSAGVVHDPAQARRYGDLIDTEGRRLTDMVEQVLEYAGLSGNRRPMRAQAVAVAPLLDEVVASCAPLYEPQGFDVQVESAADLPAVPADPEAIRRALTNLVTNAIKHGADGRWIGVTAVSAKTRGRTEVQIAVSDRGRGIDAADLPHVFEPFYRGQRAVDRQIQGNGLGLSLVRRIAEAHGGRVTVVSAPASGTTFTLHLPAVEAESAPAAAGRTIDAPGSAH
jgi:signal transduction histidine kinase